MPTYRTGPAQPTTAAGAKALRPLICEKCLEALGNIAATDHYSGLTAHMVMTTWPDMAGFVREHEAKCGRSASSA